MEQQSILRDIIFIIFDRLKLILIVFISVFLLFFLYAVLTPDQYKSSSVFNVSISQTFDPLQQEIGWDYQERARRVLQAQRDMIFSSRVLEHVVFQFYPDTKSENYTKVLDVIRQRLAVVPPEGSTFAESNTFYIEYTDLKPERTAEIASFITNVYIKEFEAVAREKADYSYVFFQDQTEKLYDDMTRKAEILRDYEHKQALALVEILALDPDNPSVAEVGPNALLNEFQRRYYELSQDLSSINTAIRVLENEISKNRVPALPQDMEVFGRAVVTYKNKVTQLEILMNEMGTQFTENFVPFQHTKKEFELSVDSLREEIARTIRAQKMNAETISTRLEEVEKVITELQERIKNTAFERSEYERIKQDYNVARETYLSVKDKSEQARLSSAVNQAEQHLTLVERPMIPTRPASPNRPLIITLGFFAALLLGLGLAIATDFFDHTLKKPQDIETYFKVPTLGSLSDVT